MRRVNWVSVAISVTALLAAAWAIYIAYGYLQTAAAGRSLGVQVAEVCAKGGPAAVELGQACVKAAEVKDQPPPVALPAPTVDPEVLRAAARTALIDYCSTRNGCRGADGRTPDVDAIVTAVVARIPVPKNGTNGENGQAGQNATAEQVAAAVAAYCGQASEPCRGAAGQKGDTGDRGEPGVQGAQGVSVTDVAPIRDDNGQCQWVVSLHDPATGKDSTVTHPASDAACAPPPSTTPNPIPVR